MARHSAIFRGFFFYTEAQYYYFSVLRHCWLQIVAPEFELIDEATLFDKCSY